MYVNIFLNKWKRKNSTISAYNGKTKHSCHNVLLLKLNAETLLHPTIPIDVMNLMTTPDDQSNTQNSKFQLIPCSHDNSTSSARHGMAHWLYGFLKTIPYNYCQISKRMKIEKMKLHQRHRRRVIMVSHNIHNIIPMAKYTSCCTPIDFVYSLPVAFVLIPLPKSTKTSSYAC